MAASATVARALAAGGGGGARAAHRLGRQVLPASAPPAAAPGLHPAHVRPDTLYVLIGY